MHNFPQIRRPLTLYVKPMGVLMRLDILKVTGVWIEKSLDSLAKHAFAGVLVRELISASAFTWC